MPKGKIVDWKSDRGFGFVRPHVGGRDVFLHIGDLRHAGYEPQVGDEVRFAVSQDEQGRPRAAGAVIAGAPRKKRVDWADMLALAIAAVFLVGLYSMESYRPVLFAYLGMSLLAFFIYAGDKASAKAGAWRTREATLHWIGFLGGWPGAILAQVMFRHKTRKASFQIVFMAIVALHVGLWLYLQITGLPPGELIGLVLGMVELTGGG